MQKTRTKKSQASKPLRCFIIGGGGGVGWVNCHMLNDLKNFEILGKHLVAGGGDYERNAPETWQTMQMARHYVAHL